MAQSNQHGIIGHRLDPDYFPLSIVKELRRQRTKFITFSQLSLLSLQDSNSQVKHQNEKKFTALFGGLFLDIKLLLKT